MTMFVVLDGIKYKCKTVDDEVSAKKASSDFYEIIDELEKISIELSDGNYIVIGKDCLRRAVYIFED